MAKDDDNQIPPAASTAAAAAAPATTTAPSRSINSPGNTFYAIRKCESLSSPAIFTNWEDCSFYLEEQNETTGSKIEYMEFSSGLDALNYISPPGGKEGTLKSPPPRSSLATKGKCSSRGKKRPAETDVSSSPKKKKGKKSAFSAAAGRDVDEKNGRVYFPLAPKDTVLNPKKSKNDQNWETKYAELKEYKDAKGSFCGIHCNPDAKTLSNFIQNELKRVQKLLDATDPSQLRPKDREKAQRLVDLGIKPGELTRNNDAWESKFQMLRDHKEKTGSCAMTRTPDGCPVNLYAWVRQQRLAMNLFENPRDPSAPPPDPKEDPTARLANNLGEGRYARLKELGLESLHPKKHTQPQIKTLEWDDMFEQLKQFKEQHGHVKVPTRTQSILVNWIINQRVQYERMKKGQKSDMTNEKLAKLLEIGLAMSAKKRQTFSERAAEWLEYRTKHGKEPSADRNNPIGVWARSQRQKYAKKMKGEETTLTDEQIDQLNVFGFKWVTGYKRPPNTTPPKSWDERFQELCEYKEKHGNVNVPQNTPVLGSWVHRQRREFTFLKRGLSASLTPQRIEKLRSIGFVFRTRKSRSDSERKKRNIELGLIAEGEDDPDDSEDDSIDDGRDQAQAQQQPPSRGGGGLTGNAASATAAGAVAQPQPPRYGTGNARTQMNRGGYNYW